MVCFGSAVCSFLTLNYQRPGSLQNQVYPVYLSYPLVLVLPFPPQIKTLLHPTRFHCDLPDSSWLQGKIKINLFFHHLIHQLHASPSIKLPVAKMSSPAAGHHRTSPRPFGPLYFRGCNHLPNCVLDRGTAAKLGLRVMKSQFSRFQDINSMINLKQPR